MAGHRKQTGDPIRVLKRLDNRLAWWTNEIANTDDPVKRMNQSIARLASVLRLLDPARAGELADLIRHRADQATADATTDLRAIHAHKEGVR